MAAISPTQTREDPLLLICPPLTLEDVPSPIRQQKGLLINQALDLDAARDFVLDALHLPTPSTGAWTNAKEGFLSETEPLLRQYDMEMQLGLAAISAQLPIPLNRIVELFGVSMTSDLYAIVVDIDGQGNINRKYGYATGTLLLHQVSRAIAQIAQDRPEIIAHSRCGDDTFFIIVFGSGHESLAREILTSITEVPSQIGRTDIVYFTASAGIAKYQSGEQAEVWLKRAYYGCSQARRAGGNRVERNNTRAQALWSS